MGGKEQRKRRGVKTAEDIMKTLFTPEKGKEESNQATKVRFCPFPLETFSERWFSPLSGEASCMNCPKYYSNSSPGGFWNMSLFEGPRNCDNDKYPLKDIERWWKTRNAGFRDSCTTECIPIDFSFLLRKCPFVTLWLQSWNRAVCFVLF